MERGAKGVGHGDVGRGWTVVWGIAAISTW